MIKLIKTPALVQYFFTSLTWRKKSNNKNIYLTFDDRPHLTLRPFILDELIKYEAKATIF